MQVFFETMLPMIPDSYRSVNIWVYPLGLRDDDFKVKYSLILAVVAQLAERVLGKNEVLGSTPNDGSLRLMPRW